MKNKTDVNERKGGQNSPTALALRALLEGSARRDLYGYILQLCRDAGEAEELVQETCYRALTAKTPYDPALELLPWLYAIAHNAFVNNRRSFARRKVVSLDFRPMPGGETVAELIADPSEPVIEKLARDEARQAVVAGFAELPEPQREVLMVCDVEGLDYKQAAKRLRVPMGTLCSRLYRARAALRLLWLRRMT